MSVTSLVHTLRLRRKVYLLSCRHQCSDAGIRMRIIDINPTNQTPIYFIQTAFDDTHTKTLS